MCANVAQAAQNDRKTDVGLTFVEMMFAVAVGETAGQVAKVVGLVTKASGPVSESLLNASPSLAHLGLTIIVIATSWVGWYTSSATRKYMEVLRGTFSDAPPYLISFSFSMLLLDVFLVVCYFILSEAAELPVLDPTTQRLTAAASAKAETLWIAVIMATYVVWNLSVTLFATDDPHAPPQRCQRCWRMFSALISLGIVIAAIVFRSDVDTIASVLLIDAGLLFAVFLFRSRLVDASGPFWPGVARSVLLLAAAIGSIWLAGAW